MYDKNLSDDANEIKFKQYVLRVNEAIKKVYYERKRLIDKNLSLKTLTVDQVFTDLRTPMLSTTASQSKRMKQTGYLSQTLGRLNAKGSQS